LTSEENIHSDTITVPEKHKVRIHGVMQIQLVQEISFQLRIGSTSTKHEKQLPRYNMTADLNGTTFSDTIIQRRAFLSVEPFQCDIRTRMTFPFIWWSSTCPVSLS